MVHFKRLGQMIRRRMFAVVALTAMRLQEFVTMSLKFPNVVFNLRRPDEE
jgi:hypothetical protein